VADTTSSIPKGHYRALIATTSTVAADPSRFDPTGLPWVRLDGVPWVEDAHDLLSGRFLTVLNVDQTGMFEVDRSVWTGSTDPGSSSMGPQGSCADWTSTSSGQTGLAGTVPFSDGRTFKDSSRACNNGASTYLYCLQYE
jgi:hypothetical protein